jgi:ferredoxin
MKRIVLQRDKCIGCLICVDIVPDFFTIDDSDGRAVIINESLQTIQQGYYPFMTDKELKEMEQKCPVGAILIK